MLKICVVGGLGRMGKAIASVAERSEDAMISSIWEHPDIASAKPSYRLETGYSKNEVIVTSDGPQAVAPADVIVDFSSPEIFDEILKIAQDLEKPLVTGTTGIVSKRKRLEKLAELVAVVDAPNMAAGVNLMFAMIDRIARILPEDCDIEIVESHHRKKKDAPSGTAIELARMIGEITQRPMSMEHHASNRGKEIRIHSLRMGTVPGIHSVNFALEGEVLEIRHSALSRVCFASGAILAASFASRARPGLYDMGSVLGISQRRD